MADGCTYILRAVDVLKVSQGCTAPRPGYVNEVWRVRRIVGGGEYTYFAVVVAWLLDVCLYICINVHGNYLGDFR